MPCADRSDGLTLPISPLASLSPAPSPLPKAGWYDASAIVSTVADANSTAADILSKAEGDEKDFYTAVAIVAIILTVLLWISILLSLKQIMRLIAVLRECTKIFKDMFAIVLWPLVGFVFQGLVFAYGCALPKGPSNPSCRTAPPLHGLVCAHGWARTRPINPSCCTAPPRPALIPGHLGSHGPRLSSLSPLFL